MAPRRLFDAVVLHISFAVAGSGVYGQCSTSSTSWEICEGLRRAAWGSDKLLDLPQRGRCSLRPKLLTVLLIPANPLQPQVAK